MKKYLIIIFAIGFIALGSVCFYLKAQIDTASNDILNLTSTVNLQEVKITETESELDLTRSRLKETKAELVVTYNERDEALELNEELENELFDTERELDYVEENLQMQKAETSELQTEVEAIQAEVEAIQAEVETIREELQLYHDTGITVAQGIIPPYRKEPNNSIILRNNPDAINVSWSQLKSFLKEDRTDNYLYMENYYTCGNFAETMHNNAENSGIKAALVGIQFEDDSTAHALNAFVTTNRGLVFIDSTGTELWADRPQHMDCIVTVKVGKYLRYNFLFTDDWEVRPTSSKVSLVEIFW